MQEKINQVAEIVAEIWRSGRDYSQDFHECSRKERWVARIVSLFPEVDEGTLTQEASVDHALLEAWGRVVEDKWRVSKC